MAVRGWLRETLIVLRGRDLIQKKEAAHMSRYFRIAERNSGSYWPVGILRWVMVLIFVAFGIQKFTPQSAHGIVQYISHSPLVWWLSDFGVRGEAYVLGTIELCTAALLAGGAFNPFLSAFGSLMSTGTFLITWSFFFTTPGVVVWSLSSDPIAWNLTGEFLFKDVALLCVSVVLLLSSLSPETLALRRRRAARPDVHPFYRIRRDR
jgi:uncharacterized membrane protein YkgB